MTKGDPNPTPTSSAEGVLARLGLAMVLERMPTKVLAETKCGEREIRLLGPTPGMAQAIATLEVQDAGVRRVAHLLLDSNLEIVVVDDDRGNLGRGGLRIIVGAKHPCDDCPGTMDFPVLGRTKFCLYLTASCSAGGGVTCCEGEIGACVSDFTISQIDFSVCWS